VATDAEATALRALDRIEGNLAPGDGRIDLFTFLHADRTGRAVGAGVDLEQRVSRRTSLYARGWLGNAWSSDGSDIAAEALAGLRLSW
jgi:hypothetical protein